MASQNGPRILVTGVSRFLGLRAAGRLAARDDVGTVIGVDLDDPPYPIKGMEFVRADIRSPLIARVVEATKVDTIIHTNILSSPGRLGGRSQMKENNVIGTMQLLAAAQRASRIKKVVVKSSTAVYGSGPGEPSIIPEDHASRPVELGGYAKDCAEAETYTRDFGRRRRDVKLVILRTQNVIGPSMRTNISDYLSLPIVPTALGYDPRLQLLHEDDAVESLCLAAFTDNSGIYNIAADGVVYLSQALRILGKTELPLLLPFAQLTAGLVRRFELVDFPTDQLRLILFGRVVATRRAKEKLGFAPTRTTEDCIRSFQREQVEEVRTEHRPHPAWEKELFDYLENKQQEHA